MVSPDGAKLYVANEDDNLVTVIDIAEPLGRSPRSRSGSSRRAWRISPDGKTIVNTSETTNMAHFIDAATHEITDNVLVDQRPRVAEFTADGAEVWVSARRSAARSA